MSVALIAGVVRVLFWVGGMVIGWYQRRVTIVIAFGLAATSSTVFLFSNAGLPVHHLMFEYAVLVSTPIAALLMMVAAYGCRKPAHGHRRWSLW